MTDEDLIMMLAVTVETACRCMTRDHLAALSDSVAQTAVISARSCWERKALAHAETIGMLGEMTGDPSLMRVAGHAAGLTYDLAVAAGHVTDGIILSSRRRLLSHLRARDADAAAKEIEQHMRGLLFMDRLCRGEGSRPSPGRFAKLIAQPPCDDAERAVPATTPPRWSLRAAVAVAAPRAWT